MPLDFRYHLASLAAVFGALIIGILLGVAMREGPALTNQIAALRVEYSHAETLRNIDTSTNEFNEKTQGLIIAHRLDGRTIALIANPLPSAGEQLDAIRNTLEAAGANVTTTVTFSSALQRIPANSFSSLYQAMGIVDIPAQPDTKDLLTHVAQAFGVNGSQAFSALKDAKLLKFSGDPTLPVSALVYIGGAAEKESFVNDLDLPFLRACNELATPLVATEPFDVGISEISQYQTIANTTIDNIDRAAGRITLVLVLAKNISGHFGYKDSADTSVPTMTE